MGLLPKTVLWFVFVRLCVFGGGVGVTGFQIPLIFRPASLSIKTTITT